MSERLEFRPGADDPFATFQLHLIGAVAQEANAGQEDDLEQAVVVMSALARSAHELRPGAAAARSRVSSG